jgi:hypothetical protein
VRIESAYIADHVEVDPTTRTLDVRTGFQSYAKVPGLPCRHVLGLAVVVQIAFDEYDHPFSLAIEIERVDELPVMHHEDFTFEIPHGIGAMDGISHHYPFAFSLPVEFYEVGVHSVIVGDGDSDFAHIPFVVQVVTLEQTWRDGTFFTFRDVPDCHSETSPGVVDRTRLSALRAAIQPSGHPVPPSPSYSDSSGFSYPMSRERGRKHGFGASNRSSEW